MFSNSLYGQRLGNVLSRARIEAGLSQEDMSFEMNVSRATISNWEKGGGKCSLLQVMQWFSIVGKNPASAFFEIADPVDFERIYKEEDDEVITEKLFSMISSLSTRQKKNIIYLLSGSFQGDPFAMIQLFLAHAHLPMNYRFSIANNISETYKMCDKAGTLKDTGTVMPNIEELDNAIQLGRQAAIENKDSY